MKKRGAKMIIMLRNLSIALLIWMIIFFLHGFFKELYKIFEERYKDWKNKERILQEVKEKLIREGLLEWVIEKKEL